MKEAFTKGKKPIARDFAILFGLSEEVTYEGLPKNLQKELLYQTVIESGKFHLPE